MTASKADASADDSEQWPDAERAAGARADRPPIAAHTDSNRSDEGHGAVQVTLVRADGVSGSMSAGRTEAYQWFVRGVGLSLGAVFVYLVANAALLATRALILVFAAILLGSALEPIVGMLRARIPVGRGVAVLLAYLSFLAIVVVTALIVVPDAISQANQLSTRLPATLDRAQEWARTVHPQAAADALTTLISSARNAITTNRPTATPDAVIQVGLTLGEAVVLLGTLLAMVFFWLTEHARLQRYTLAFVPFDHRGGTRDAWNQVETRLGMWVRGQLLLMGTMGIMAGVAYTVLGLPAPLLLAVWAAIAEAIPLVGPLLGAIPALLLAATISPQTVVLTAVVYVFLQFIEGNVLVPIIMRNTIGISPFLVIVSLTVGAEIGGIVGAFLAVPVTAAIEVILERLQARDTPVPQDPAGLASAPASETEPMERSLPDGAGKS